MERIWSTDFLSNLNFDKNFPGGWPGFLSACAAAIVSYHVYNYGHYSYQVSKTKKKIKNRQDKRRQNIEHFRRSIEAQNGNFDPTIPKLDFKQLQDKLRSGKLTAHEVLLAFQNKALQVHEQLNCVTEFLDDAEARAIELDQLPPEQRGVLHGIPVSLKEGTVLGGRDATIGFAKSIGKIFEKDSVLVQVLKKQGALPFVRTNLSQGQMSVECSNPIFGVTKNPHDQKRTPGGSSGGEGALIGAGASVLGVGCDMAGSIRIPAHFCGVAGFKCTAKRLGNAGNYPFGFGIMSISEVYSPLGRDVDSLVEFFKATLTSTLYQLDPLLPRMSWNNSLYESTKPMKIGFYTFDGGLEPVPAVKRAVLLAKSKLEAKGHTVVEFHPHNVLYMFERLFLGVMEGDHGRHAMEAVKYDLVDPCIQELIQSYQCPMPSFMKSLITNLIPGLHPITKIIINHKMPSDISAWWDLNEELEDYKRKFTSQMTSQGISCLICPTLPFPAFPTDKAEFNFASLTYTCLYNVLSFPTGNVPTTTVNKQDTHEMEDYPNDTDVHKFVHEITKDSEGLPVGVQCVGLPFEDESVLRLMKELESSL